VLCGSEKGDKAFQFSVIYGYEAFGGQSADDRFIVLVVWLAAAYEMHDWSGLGYRLLSMVLLVGCNSNEKAYVNLEWYPTKADAITQGLQKEGVRKPAFRSSSGRGEWRNIGVL